VEDAAGVRGRDGRPSAYALGRPGDERGDCYSRRRSIMSRLGLFAGGPSVNAHRLPIAEYLDRGRGLPRRALTHLRNRPFLQPRYAAGDLDAR